MHFAKTTWGGKLPKKRGGTSPGATVVYQPMVQKVSGKVDKKAITGKVE